MSDEAAALIDDELTMERLDNMPRSYQEQLRRGARLSRLNEEERFELHQTLKIKTSQELRSRDNREFGIPPSGSTLLEVDTRSGTSSMPEADWVRNRYSGSDLLLECHRRMEVLRYCLPQPAELPILLDMIRTSDGKTREGQWCCQRPSGEYFPERGAGDPGKRESRSMQRINFGPLDCVEETRPGKYRDVFEKYRNPKWLLDAMERWGDDGDQEKETEHESVETSGTKLRNRRRIAGQQHAIETASAVPGRTAVGVDQSVDG